MMRSGHDLPSHQTRNSACLESAVVIDMDEEHFLALKDEIDQAVDSDASGKLGIAMSFRLAGQFLERGLLDVVHFEFLGNWDTRTYRGRYVLPDPWLDDFQFRLGAST